MSKAYLLILAGLLLMAGMAGCDAPDLPSTDQRDAKQSMPDTAGSSPDLQPDLRDEIRRSELAEKKVLRMQAEIEVLQDQNADLTRQLQTFESVGLDLADCRRDFQDLESRLEQERELDSNMCAEQTSLIEERFDQQGINAALRDLKAELAAVEQKLKTTRDDLAQANGQITSLQTELRTLEQNHSKLQVKADRVIELEEILSIMQAEKAIMEQKNAQETVLAKQLSDTRRELAEALTRLQEKEARLQQQ